MVLKFALMMFASQLVFIGLRTVNVRAVASGNLTMALITGAGIHIAWLVSIALGSFSMYEIVANFKWEYTWIVLASTSGGLLGTWMGMKKKKYAK
jgi:hypothetical protein